MGGECFICGGLHDEADCPREAKPLEESNEAKLRATLAWVATSPVNPTTCGACGLPFHECELDRVILDAGVPVDEPACIGARARAVLAETAPNSTPPAIPAALETETDEKIDRRKMAEEIVDAWLRANVGPEGPELEPLEVGRRFREFAIGWIEAAAQHAAGEAYYRDNSRLRDNVKAFHVAVDQPILEKPAVPSEDRVRLRMRLLTEEFFETLQAVFGEIPPLDVLGAVRTAIEVEIAHTPLNVNLPELADGLADLDYISEGTRLEFGVNGGPIAAAVHRANMAKVGAEKREDGKFLKPPGWAPPDVAGELKKQGWKP